MLPIENSCTVTDFARNVHSHMENLRASRRPLFLICDDDVQLVVQNVEAYHELLERLEELETLAALYEAAGEVERGEATLIEVTEARMRQRLNIGVGREGSQDTHDERR